MIYEVSQTELSIINEAMTHEDRQIKINPLAINGTDGYSIDLDENEAGELRELCGDYLAVIGFDENYNPNEKGRVLESLIDKLFVP